MTDTTTVMQESLQKIAENSSSLQGAVGQFFDYIKTAITQYGPDTYQLLLTVVRVQAIISTIVGIILIIAGVIGLTYSIKYYKKIYNNIKLRDDVLFCAYALTTVGTIASCTLIVTALFAKVINTTNLLTIYSPEAGIMYRLVERFL